MFDSNKIDEAQFKELINVLSDNIQGELYENRNVLNEKEKLVIKTLLDNILNYKISKVGTLTLASDTTIKKVIEPIKKTSNVESDKNLIPNISLSEVKECVYKLTEGYKDVILGNFSNYNYTLPVFTTADLDLSYMLKYLVHSESIANSTYSDGGDMNVKLYDNNGNRIDFPLLSFSKRLQQHYTPGSKFILTDNTRIEGNLFINKGQKRIVIKRVNEKEINGNANVGTLKKVSAKVNDGQGEMLVDEMIALVASKGLVDLNHIRHIKKSCYSYRKYNMLKLFFEIAYATGMAINRENSVARVAVKRLSLMANRVSGDIRAEMNVFQSV